MTTLCGFNTIKFQQSPLLSPHRTFLASPQSFHRISVTLIMLGLNFLAVCMFIFSYSFYFYFLKVS